MKCTSALAEQQRAVFADFPHVTVMSPTDPTFWYVRKPGWVSGPYTRDQIRHMYATGLISKGDRVATNESGPWKPIHTVPDLISEGEQVPPQADAVWEIASDQYRGPQPVSFAILKMLAATGSLSPADCIRRDGGPWQRADSVPGLFDGSRAWCTACGCALDTPQGVCPQCGAPQPVFEPSTATFALTCGAVACVWSVVGTATVIALAVRRDMILGVAMDENFPQAFAIALAPAAMCAILAVTLGRVARQAMYDRRSAPTHRPFAVWGERLGWAAWLGLTIVGVAVTFFSMAYFRIFT